jgi:hypothetical protein
VWSSSRAQSHLFRVGRRKAMEDVRSGLKGRRGQGTGGPNQVKQPGARPSSRAKAEGVYVHVPKRRVDEEMPRMGVPVHPNAVSAAADFASHANS